MDAILNWEPSWGVEKLEEMEKLGQLDHLMISNLPIETYHHAEAPGLSSSTIVGIKKSLLHIEIESELRKETPALVFGNFIHTAILEPHLLHKEYSQKIDEPKIDKRTKEGKAAYAKWVDEKLLPWEKENIGKIQMSKEDWIRCELMAESVREHSEFMEFFNAGLKEISFFSRCPKTGFLQKCRTDLFVPQIKVAIDLKSTIDASGHGFGKACMNYDYIIKQAYYDLILSRFFKGNINYLFMAVESVAPFDCQLFEIQESDIDVGRDYVKSFMEKYSSEKKGITRKGYPRGIQTLKMPAYFYNADKYDI